MGQGNVVPAVVVQGDGGGGNVILFLRIQRVFFSNLCHSFFFIFQSINFTDPFYAPPVVVVHQSRATSITSRTLFPLNAVPLQLGWR